MAREIPFFDIRPSLDPQRGRIDEAVRRVVDSGTVVLGPEVEAFEREFARYTGAPHAIGVASGTDALALALRAVGVESGDEVLTVANAGVPVGAAIRAVGAFPRYVDVDPGHLMIEPSAVASSVTSRTRAMLVVHLYGQPLRIAELVDCAARWSLPVIEDCAHAHGLRIDGRHVGTFGAVGCFSFYPTKNLGALGDAGACITNDEECAAALRRLRVYGADSEGSVAVAGVNSRLDALQAAILRVLLHDLDANVAKRRRLAAVYDDLLRGTEVIPLNRDGSTDAYHLYVVRHPAPQRLIRGLAAAGVGAKSHYPSPLHRMPAFAVADASQPGLPNTEAGCAQVLSLPLYPGLDESDVRRIAEVLGSL